jgi:hypothetical protein
MPIKRSLGTYTRGQLIIGLTAIIRNGPSPYAPLGPDPARIDGVIYASSGLPFAGARPSWFPNVRRFVISRQLFRRATEDTPPMRRCDACNYYMPIIGMQIDHVAGWATSVAAGRDPRGVALTNLEARILYNDPHILRCLCVVCNTAQAQLGGPALATRARNRERVVAAWNALL